MKKILPALLGVAAAVLSVAPVAVAQTAPAPIRLATTATVLPASLGLSATSRIATLAVSNCAQPGFNVSVTVVDRSGVTLAVAHS